VSQGIYDCRVSTTHFTLIDRSGDVGPTKAGEQ
jgi:hypothetical protein